jgi:hypothetical protein
MLFMLCDTLRPNIAARRGVCVFVIDTPRVVLVLVTPHAAR